MDCYSYRGGRLAYGIEVSSDAGGEYVALGEAGRGRRLETIRVAPGLSADEGGRRCVGTSVGIDAVGPESAPRFELVERDGDGFIVRADTNGPYTRGSPGGVDRFTPHPALGAGAEGENVFFVASGHRAWGDAGRLGSLFDRLYVVKEGGSLLVRQAGGSKGVGTRIIWAFRGALKCGTLPEYWDDMPSILDGKSAAEMKRWEDWFAIRSQRATAEVVARIAKGDPARKGVF